MKDLLLGIILISIIIFGVFIYTIQTIRKQKKLSDIKNDFINNMTHELNTPISTISVAGRNLMKDDINKDPSKIKELGSTIIRQNKRLQKTVSQVMDSSILDSPVLKKQKEKCLLHELLHEIIADFETRNTSDDFEIRTDFLAEKDEISLDKFQFTSAINNLIDNAKKYSKPPLKLHVSTGNKGAGILIQISDNGIGISPANLHLVFEKFYRVPQGNIHNVKGLGLGLFMVKQIIEMHDGQIEIKSSLGKGSTVVIHLPY